MDSQSIDAAKLHGFNKDALYRQEVFVDPDAGEIICWTPIHSDATIDNVRVRRFFSALTINVNNQPMPLRFEIKNCTSIEEVIGKWKDEAAIAGNAFMEQMRARQTGLVGPSGRRLDS